MSVDEVQNNCNMIPDDEIDEQIERIEIENDINNNNVNEGQDFHNYMHHGENNNNIDNDNLIPDDEFDQYIEQFEENENNSVFNSSDDEICNGGVDSVVI